jgi:hypothetical protein
MTLRERQHVFARTMGLFLAWMAEKDYYWTMGDAWRSSDKLLCPECGMPVTYQDLLVNNGRSKTRNSKHADRLAFDLILFTSEGKIAPNEDYQPLGEKWKALGGKWGGDWTMGDFGHFEGI